MTALLYEKRENVAILTLNRPEKLNAMDHHLQGLLAEAWDEFAADDSLRVAIVTGAGRAFSAGADLLTAAPAYVDPTRRPQGQRSGIMIPDMPKVVIAAVNGYCVAGAFALALQCDIRLASEDAVLGGSGAKLGLFPAGQCVRLAKIIPPSKALLMLAQAEYLGAREAYECGLVDRVFPAGELLPAAIRVADRIAANAPLVVQQLKEAVRASMTMPLAEGLALEQEFFRVSGATADGREGLQAWAERRKPQFTGR